MKIDECLYTQDAIIIKDKYYGLIDTPQIIDCITIPAINLNKSYVKDYYSITKSKIQAMMDLALIHNCDNLVLGAWGCGVFNNDPQIISTMFMEIISKEPKRFNNIVFGVINDHNSVDNNYEIFKKQLEDPQ